MHPGDRAAGEDVVELEQQRSLPQRVDLGLIDRAETTGGDECPYKLEGAQRVLEAAVALLHLELRGEDPAVELEIELATVHRRGVRVLLPRRVEEPVGLAHLEARGTLEIAAPTSTLDHVGRRAAAPVAVAEGDHLVRGPAAFCE